MKNASGGGNGVGRRGRQPKSPTKKSRKSNDLIPRRPQQQRNNYVQPQAPQRQYVQINIQPVRRPAGGETGGQWIGGNTNPAKDRGSTYPDGSRTDQEILQNILLDLS